MKLVIKSWMSWFIPNAAITATFCYWRIYGSEWAYNLVIFALWFFIITWLMSVFSKECISKLSASRVPILLKWLVAVVYVFALAASGWFVTAAFFAAMEMLVFGRVTLLRKEQSAEVA